MNRILRALAFVFGAILLCGAPALAAEGGATSPENTPLGWAFRWINFAITFLGIAYLCIKKAPAFFAGRAEQIVRAITEARMMKEEAQAMLRDAEAKLARLDQEVAALRATAKKDGLAEAERIRDMARQEEAKIQAAAQAEIAAAERAARMELKAVAAQLVVERAGALVKARMTPEAQTALVRAFVENLGRAN